MKWRTQKLTFMENTEINWENHLEAIATSLKCQRTTQINWEFIRKLVKWLTAVALKSVALESTDQALYEQHNSQGRKRFPNLILFAIFY